MCLMQTHNGLECAVEGGREEGEGRGRKERKGEEGERERKEKIKRS